MLRANRIPAWRTRRRFVGQQRPHGGGDEGAEEEAAHGALDAARELEEVCEVEGHRGHVGAHRARRADGHEVEPRQDVPSVLRHRVQARERVAALCDVVLEEVLRARRRRVSREYMPAADARAALHDAVARTGTTSAVIWRAKNSEWD